MFEMRAAALTPPCACLGCRLVLNVYRAACNSLIHTTDLLPRRLQSACAMEPPQPSLPLLLPLAGAAAGVGVGWPAHPRHLGPRHRVSWPLVKRKRQQNLVDDVDHARPARRHVSLQHGGAVADALQLLRADGLDQERVYFVNGRGGGHRGAGLQRDTGPQAARCCSCTQCPSVREHSTIRSYAAACKQRRMQLDPMHAHQSSPQAGQSAPAQR